MRLLRSLISLICLLGLLFGVGGCTQTYSTTVKSAQKISQTNGNLNANLNAGDRFGAALANIGDLDQDGIPDLAVGSPDDDESGNDRGAVWILFMDNKGRVKNRVKITAGVSGFAGSLNDSDHFGSAVASPGDLDGDGIPDLVVGAPGDDDNGPDRGALWVLFLNRNGSVRTQQKISDVSGGFVAGLQDNDQFAGAIAAIGDLNGDGITDLVVGSAQCDDGGSNRGAVYILFMNHDGTTQSQQKISATAGNFHGDLHDEDHFGSAVTRIGDLDGDGVMDIAVGASGDDSGGSDRGAVWVMFMNRDGTVKSAQKIAQDNAKFDQLLADGDNFGSALADVGDLNGDGIDELAVGADQSGDGGPVRGAVYILFLKKTAEVISSSRISQLAGKFPGSLNDGEQFGAALVGLGDLDGDGNKDIVVGADMDNDGGTATGASWVLFMSAVKLGYRIDPSANLDSYFRGKR
jgi:hypothetical protein